MDEQILIEDSTLAVFGMDNPAEVKIKKEDTKKKKEDDKK